MLTIPMKFYVEAIVYDVFRKLFSHESIMKYNINYSKKFYKNNSIERKYQCMFHVNHINKKIMDEL